jgi:hypothetical protein
MTNLLAPVPKFKAFDNNGRPANGYKLFTYEAGTSTKANTFPSADSVVPNDNPIILDYRGECDLWIPPNVSYKVVLSPPADTDPPTAPVWTVDDIIVSQLLTLYGGVDTGVANQYVVDYDASWITPEDGTVIYFLASNQNTGASTFNPNGIGPAPILTPNGESLYPGAIAANQIVGVIAVGAAWYLITSTVLSGSFSASLSGMTAPTIATIEYRISGGVCTLFSTSGNTGTSNSAVMSMTGIPSPCLPQEERLAFTSAVNNNVRIFAGAAVTPSGIAFSPFLPSGSFVQPGAFTNSGLKGIGTGWMVSYPL